MHPADAEVIVAGHICLDIIPELTGTKLGEMLVPGKLVNVGKAITSTGGAVSNTGIALHRLGLRTRLMGKVADDLFGGAILKLLRQHGETLADGMVVRGGEQSSYTLVISPQGADRIFLHCPGTNDTFEASDVRYDELGAARLFHFGYPPLMRAMYRDDGEELVRMFSGIKERGLTASLDMSRPDPDSEAGLIDWARLLHNVLPNVDVYLPSLEETMFMLDRERFDRWNAEGGEELLRHVSGKVLAELADRLLAMGPAVVGIKLGDQGLYVRTTADAERIRRMGRGMPADPAAWSGRELLAPCFSVKAAGTTGAGDCTIAGFLAGLLHGLSLEETMSAAVGVGACNVEAVDAVSGVRSWSEVRGRIADGWERLPTGLKLTGWSWEPGVCLWKGPHDQTH